MTEEKKPAEETHVSCDICMKEIPASEAKSEEGSDYVYHFCGLECYSQWKEQSREEE